MEWTDIQITVPQQYAETAEAIATMVSNGGIYIEDYRDLEQQAWEIAHVDLIEQDLLHELNKDNIPNLANIDERFLDLSFDPENRYSVPYFWGTE